MTHNEKTNAAGETLRRIYVYNGGFLTQTRTRRIMRLAGYDISIGKPGPDDAVAVWGQSPTAPRGEAVAKKTDTPLIRVEDAFLRSVLTGRDDAPAMGLHIDKRGVHFDARRCVSESKRRGFKHVQRNAILRSGRPSGQTDPDQDTPRNIGGPPRRIFQG